MKLSTKSRYGTRMILDLAQHHGQGAIQLGEIAKRQKISLKYLEQIIRPLKKAGFVKSFRGAKGGHILNKPPGEVTVAAITFADLLSMNANGCREKFMDFLTSKEKSS